MTQTEPDATPSPERGRPRTAARRSYGTGSLAIVTDAGGRETWYGKWYSNGTRVKRRIGAVRTAGARDGLTKAQAEKKLRALMDSVPREPIRARVHLGIRGGSPRRPRSS